MKKLIFALVVIAALATSAFASAAGMSVQGGTVQAGTDGDLICQTGTIAVDSWQIFGLGATNPGQVETVTVKGSSISPACVGNRLMLAVYTSDGRVYHSYESVTGGDYFKVIAPADLTSTIQFYLGWEDGTPATNSKLDPALITGVTFIIEGSNGR